MSNKEEFDEHENDSSDAEGDSKAKYESLLSNPSYFSSAMKVRKCVLDFACRSCLKFNLITACSSEEYGKEFTGSSSKAC